MSYSNEAQKQDYIKRLLIFLDIYLRYCVNWLNWDVSVEVENTFCNLFSLIQGSKFDNLNCVIRPNFPWIDIGNVVNKLWIQITVVDSFEKVKHTIEMFETHKVYDDYNKLEILIPTFSQLTKHSESITKTLSSDKYNFNLSSDKYNLTKLVDLINKIHDLNDLSQIYTFLKNSLVSDDLNIFNFLNDNFDSILASFSNILKYITEDRITADIAYSICEQASELKKKIEIEKDIILYTEIYLNTWEVIKNWNYSESWLKLDYNNYIFINIIDNITELKEIVITYNTSDKAYSINF